MEAQAFQYFTVSTTSQLKATLDDDTWIQPVLQLADSNLALRQALIAVGIMSKRYEINDVSISKSQQDLYLQHNAQFHYHQAILELKRDYVISKSGDIIAPESRLFCYIFLSMIQFLQGNPLAVLGHLNDSVMYMKSISNPTELQQKIATFIRLKDMVTALWLNNDRAISDTEVEFQALFTNPLPPYASTNTTLEALGEEMSRMANEMLGFRHLIACSRGDDTLTATKGVNPAPASSTHVKQVLKSRLDIWYQKFVWASKLPNEREASFRRPLLHANYLMHVLTVDQVDTDDFTESFTETQRLVLFEQIIQLTNEAFNSGGPTKRYDCAGGERPIEATGLLPLYAFRLSFIRPLFFVAQQAPSLQLRKRAIRFLLHEPWREGAWDSAIMASIAKKQLADTQWNYKDIGTNLGI